MEHTCWEWNKKFGHHNENIFKRLAMKSGKLLPWPGYMRAKCTVEKKPSPGFNLIIPLRKCNEKWLSETNFEYFRASISFQVVAAIDFFCWHNSSIYGFFSQTVLSWELLSLATSSQCFNLCEYLENLYRASWVIALNLKLSVSWYLSTKGCMKSRIDVFTKDLRLTRSHI